MFNISYDFISIQSLYSFKRMAPEVARKQNIGPLQLSVHGNLTLAISHKLKSYPHMKLGLSL